MSKHHFQNGPVPLRFTTGDDLINWSLSVRMRSVPVRFWGDLQALFLVLWAVNIQELSPNSIARLCVCLPIIPELSKCDLPWKFLYLGRRGGLACTTKTKYHATMSIFYQHNNKQKLYHQFYINDLDFRATQWGEGLPKLKPVSNVIKYKVNLYKLL